MGPDRRGDEGKGAARLERELVPGGRLLLKGALGACSRRKTVDNQSREQTHQPLLHIVHQVPVYKLYMDVSFLQVFRNHAHYVSILQLR